MSSRTWYGLLCLIAVITPLVIQADIPLRLRGITPVLGWLLAAGFLRLALSRPSQTLSVTSLDAFSAKERRLNEIINYSRFVALIAALAAGGVFESQRPIRPLGGIGLFIFLLISILAILFGIIIDVFVARRRDSNDKSVVPKL